MTTLTTPEQISRFHLASLKGAVKMEKLGMKHSSGHSATAHARKLFGLKRTASHDEVLACIQKELDNA
jgi:hypothetical protein